jgi:uncharacterized protein YjbI with pentapeptide repeats
LLIGAVIGGCASYALQIVAIDSGGTSQAQLALAQVHVDALRNAVTVTAVLAGAAVLAVRLREQQRQEYFRAQQRIAELHVKAVEQLGSASPAARIGGLQSLERLGEQHPEMQQVILDIVCSYLRIPYDLPAVETSDIDEPWHDGPEVISALGYEDAESAAELEVRLFAQEILQRHLKVRSADDDRTAWNPERINLRKAHLHGMVFRECHLQDADFTDATFTGDAFFDDATFTGDTIFTRTRFAGDAYFERVNFGGDAHFGGATFNDDAYFGDSAFTSDAKFGPAEFNGDTYFGRVRFSGAADFGRAVFNGATYFDGVMFTEVAQFGAARFNGPADFGSANFTREARFEDTAFTDAADFMDTEFGGDADIKSAQFARGVRFRNQSSGTRTGSRRHLAAAASTPVRWRKVENQPDPDLWQLIREEELSDGPLAIDQRETMVSQTPVNVWLGIGNNHEAVEAALSVFLEEVGLEITVRGEPEIGSWFRSSIARLRRDLGHLSPAQVAAEAERKLRIEVFDKQQAAIDNQKATGAAALITSLQSESEACIQMGSILLLKSNNRVVCRNLSQLEMAWLDRNPTLLRDPISILEKLEELAQGDEGSGADRQLSPP